MKFIISESNGISLSHIDEQEELIKYQEEVLAKARETMAEDDDVVVIDTAPTGNTLLLLVYAKLHPRSGAYTRRYIPDSVKKLLLMLRNVNETEVIIL